jgi:hypothetical protein
MPQCPCPAEFAIRTDNGIDKSGNAQAFMGGAIATAAGLAPSQRLPSSVAAPAIATSASQSTTPASNAAGQRQTCHHRRSDSTPRSATNAPPLDIMFARRILPSPNLAISSPRFATGELLRWPHRYAAILSPNHAIVIGYLAPATLARRAFAALAA